jgi:hypothetical protein
MDQGPVDVIVDGVRCQVVKQDGERLLVQPLNNRGAGINVTRWVPVQATQPLPVALPTAVAKVLTDEEIRHLAAVLRQVFYEDGTADGRTVASR